MNHIPPPPPAPGRPANFIPPPPPGVGQQRPPGPPGGQVPPQFMQQMPIRQPLQQSSRISDISPAKFMDEAACLKKLTSYAVYTIRKAAPRDARERPTWAKAEVVEERWAQEDIVKQMKKLGESKRTVADKKAALAQFQQGQITTLLDDLGSKEMEPAFEWNLVQLDRKEAPLSSLKGSGKKSQYETVTMTVYVTRAPRKDVNAVSLFQTLENMKADRMRMLPPQQQQQQQQQQKQGGQQQQGGQGGQQQQQRAPPPPGFVQLPKAGPQQHPQGHPSGGHKPKIMKQEKGRPNKSPKKYHGRSSSSSESDYDSDTADSSSSSEGTSISSRSRGHRKHSKGAVRSRSRHRPKYYLEGRSDSPRRRLSDAFGGIPAVQQRPYVPDVPRVIAAHDPITSAYQAGKEDAIAERFGVADRFTQPPQPVVVERIIEKPVISYGRFEPQYVERPRRIEPRYIEDRYIDDRSVQDDYIVNQRQAEQYIERRPLDRPEFHDRRPSDFDRRPLDRPEFFERRHSEARPDVYERRHEARPEFFERRPIREFERRQSPPRFSSSSHPFAPAQFSRNYPSTPSSTSGGYPDRY